MDGIPSLKIKTPPYPPNRISIQLRNCACAFDHEVDKWFPPLDGWSTASTLPQDVPMGRVISRNNKANSAIRICNLTYNNIFHVLSIHLHVSLASLCLFINFWMKVFSRSFVLLFSSLRCLSFCTNPVNSFFIYVFTRNINFIQNPKRITQVYRIYIANNLLHLYSSSFESFEAS